MDEVIQGTPICMEHDCTYICLNGVDLVCPGCELEKQEKKVKGK